MRQHDRSYNIISIPIFWGSRKYCEYVEIEDLYGEEEGTILLKQFLEQTIKELNEKEELFVKYEPNELSDNLEKVIRDKNGKLPLDYKFMCFDGEPKLLFLDIGCLNF